MIGGPTLANALLAALLPKAPPPLGKLDGAIGTEKVTTQHSIDVLFLARPREEGEPPQSDRPNGTSPGIKSSGPKLRGWHVGVRT
jgi:hypothetical protein